MCTEPLKLISRERWDELKLVAQSDWPRSISLLTLLDTEEYILNHGIDYGFKVYCPNGIMTNGIVAINPKHRFYEVIILCPKDDISELEKALRTTDLIEWSKINQFPFVPKNVADCVKRIVIEKELLFVYTKTEAYLLKDDTNLFDVSLTPDLKFELLSLDCVPTIDRTWPHKYEGTEWYHEFLIKAKLGYGLFKNGELVAWSFINEVGALGHLHTLENHRKKGYGELVVKLLSNVLMKEKKRVYAYCLVGNTAGSNLFKKLGFTKVFEVEWMDYEDS